MAPATNRRASVPVCISKRRDGISTSTKTLNKLSPEAKLPSLLSLTLVILPDGVRTIFAKLDELSTQSNKQRAKRWRRWRAFLVTATLTGMRASELRGLHWSAVDLTNGTMEVTQRADEKGIIGPPKSEAGERTINISSLLVTMLREWKLECPPGDFVFPNWQGRVEMLGNVHRAWKPVLQKCKLKSMRFHALRHFHASMLIAGGANSKEVQVEMGHSTITVTYDLYGKLFKDDEGARKARAERLASELF